MARIVLTTVGSGGDAFPFLPIADELERRGYEVVLAAPPALVHVLRDGVRTLTPIGPFQARDAVRRFHAFDHRWWGYRGLDGFWHLLLEGLERTVVDLRPIVADADLVLTHVFHPAAVIAAEAEGVPFATLDLHPSFQPSRHHPPPGLPSTGSLGNRGAWQALRAVWRRRLDPAINAARLAHGLGPIRDAALVGGLSSLRCLDLTSSWYTETPSDRRVPSTAVGYPQWDSPARLAPPDDAHERLLDGDRPVVVFTLGTALSMDPGPFYEIVGRTLDGLDHAALVLGGPAGDVPAGDGRRVLHRPYLPLSSVLPRAAAVVHHAGAGTTQAALRAGCPAVTVPRCFDQRYHAGRVEALGAGRSLPWSQLEPRRLERELRRLIDDGHYRRRTQALADRIAAEPAAEGLIADAIDELMVRT